MPPANGGTIVCFIGRYYRREKGTLSRKYRHSAVDAAPLQQGCRLEPLHGFRRPGFPQPSFKGSIGGFLILTGHRARIRRRYAAIAIGIFFVQRIANAFGGLERGNR